MRRQSQPQAPRAVAHFQEAIPRPRMIEFRFQVEQEGVDLLSSGVDSESGPACPAQRRLPEAAASPPTLSPPKRRRTGFPAHQRNTTRQNTNGQNHRGIRVSSLWPNECPFARAFQRSRFSLLTSTPSPQYPASNCPTQPTNRQTTTPPATTASFKAPSRARTNYIVTWKFLVHSRPAAVATAHRPRPTADSPSSPRRTSAVAAYGVP